MSSKFKSKLQRLKRFAIGSLLCSAVVAGGAFAITGCKDNGGGGGDPVIVVDEVSYTAQEKAKLVNGMKAFLKVEDVADETDAIEVLKHNTKVAVAESLPEIFKNYKVSNETLAVVAQYLQKE